MRTQVGTGGGATFSRCFHPAALGSASRGLCTAAHLLPGQPLPAPPPRSRPGPAPASPSPPWLTLTEPCPSQRTSSAGTTGATGGQLPQPPRRGRRGSDSQRHSPALGQTPSGPQPCAPTGTQTRGHAGSIGGSSRTQQHRTTAASTAGTRRPAAKDGVPESRCGGHTASVPDITGSPIFRGPEPAPGSWPRRRPVLSRRLRSFPATRPAKAP